MNIKVGQAASVERAFSQEDFDRFAALSGDDNPIHVDPEFSARTAFGKTVAHGMLLYGTVCGVLGTQLPGPGTMQLEQELMFPNPTYVGEQVVIRLEVTKLQLAEGLADLTTVITRPGGEVGLQGRTLVRLPGETHAPRPYSSSFPSWPSIPFKGMEIGQRAETRRTFTHQDLVEYASLTGDTNPELTDPEADSIIPGSLLGGLPRHVLMGLLTPVLGRDQVNVVNAAVLAENRGISVSTRRLARRTLPGERVEVEVTTSGGPVSLDGALLGEHHPSVRCKIFYQRDYLHLLIKYGLESATEEQATAPTRIPGPPQIVNLGEVEKAG